MVKHDAINFSRSLELLILQMVHAVTTYLASYLEEKAQSDAKSGVYIVLGQVFGGCYLPSSSDCHGTNVVNDSYSYIISLSW